MNAYRLMFEGPRIDEEITVEAASIAEAARVADEYRELLEALLDPPGEEPSKGADGLTARPELLVRIELQPDPSGELAMA